MKSENQIIVQCKQPIKIEKCFFTRFVTALAVLLSLFPVFTFSPHCPQHIYAREHKLYCFITTFQLAKPSIQLKFILTTR